METKRRFDSFSGDNLSPLVKVAPTLMHAENLSMQSLARSGRAVGVTDLREALEGRSSMSNPNLVAGRVPSISTLDHTSSVFPEGFGKLTPTRSRPQQRVKPRPGEVKDVLNKSREKLEIEDEREQARGDDANENTRDRDRGEGHSL